MAALALIPYLALSSASPMQQVVEPHLKLSPQAFQLTVGMANVVYAFGTCWRCSRRCAHAADGCFRRNAPPRSCTATVRDSPTGSLPRPGLVMCVFGPSGARGNNSPSDPCFRWD
jgi:hypothetical protein